MARRWMLGLGTLMLVTGFGLACASDSRSDDPVTIGLITKSDDNPFFVAMQEGALERADELGIELRTYAGDRQSQQEAVEELVEIGADAILITPVDPQALTDAVAAARDAGLVVMALDTPFDPVDAVDGTFATNNFEAGRLIGEWARATLGPAAADARIATLDGLDPPITLDMMRNQGFLDGFGVDLNDPDRLYDETDPRVVAGAPSFGSEPGGEQAMAALMDAEPGIDVVYAINEPAAAGAVAALRSLGRASDVLIVTIDGACSGVRLVAEGSIGATAMQFPVRMAVLGIDAVVARIDTAAEPDTSEGLGFLDTGVALVTDAPVEGMASITSTEALSQCWG